MALEDPYPLDFFSDLLRTSDAVALTLKRNDEQSGSGDGRFWTAQLARPLWTADMTLDAYSYADIFRAREIDAKARALNGSRRSFLWADPTYAGPSVASVSALLSATVAIESISSDRTQIALTGLPPFCHLIAGDRFSVSWGTDRYYLAELADSVTADASGLTGQVPVMPYLPLGVNFGDAVELVKPICRMVVQPSGYTPFGYQRQFVASGAAISMLQKP